MEFVRNLFFNRPIYHIEKDGFRGLSFGGKNYFSFSSLPVKQSAIYNTTPIQKLFLADILLILTVGFILDWRQAIIYFVGLITFIYFADLLFNLLLVIRSYIKPPEINISNKEFSSIRDEDLPTYTILCPLYKEWKVLDQFVKGIADLEYPKSKLQVLLLFEQDDTKTIQKASDARLPSYFERITIPYSKPKTKPKALNYGLMYAKGEYVVIYDAEDIPEKFQLKKAILAFKKSGATTKCIQAKLNFYNTRQNILTRVFAAEYSLWFDLILTGLQSINAPVPLGGTSNHFKRKDINNFSGWDAFNVTEDADLGVRIAKSGCNTAIMNSTTYEEANSSISNWFWQRTRWIKGYIQTYLVHMREPKDLAVNQDSIHALTFQLVIGGKIASLLINPVMWILTIAYFTLRSQIGPTIESFFPPLVFYMGVMALFVGNFLYMYYYMVGCAKRGQYDIIKYVFLVPFYWLGMSIAAYFSVYKFFATPHYWFKTRHGLHFGRFEKSQIFPNVAFR